MKSAGERIRSIRKKTSLNQTEFAEKIGISQANLSELEIDKRLPSKQTLIAIEYLFSINRVWVDTGEGQMTIAPPHEATHINEGAVAPYETSPSRLSEFTLVPKYDIEASAGHGRVVNSEQIVDHLAFKTTWIKRALGLNPHNLVLITAVGDSMKTTIGDGDLLLLDRAVEKITKDSIYCIMVDSTLVVKRVQHLLDGTVVIKSDNPAYQTQELTAEEAGRLHVIGRLVWVGSMV